MCLQTNAAIEMLVCFISSSQSKQNNYFALYPDIWIGFIVYAIEIKKTINLKSDTI